MFHKVVIFIVAAILMSPVGAYAGRFSGISEWLNISPSPRGAGVGLAYYGIARGAASSLYNPAAPGFISYREINAHYGLLPSDLMYNSLSYIEPDAGDGSVSFIIQHFGTPRMQKIRGGTLEDKFQNYDIAVNLGYAYTPTDRFAIGLNLKGIQSKLGDYTALGGGVDIGMFGKPFRNTYLGIAVSNISTPFSYRNINEYLPFNISSGLSYSLNLASEEVELIFALGARYMDYEEWEMAFGMEHIAYEQFSLRVGYQYNNKDRHLSFPANFSAGVGVNVSSILVDYAWVPYGEMGYTHRFALGYRFKESPRKIISVNIKAAPSIYSPSTGELTLKTRWEGIDGVVNWWVEVVDSYGIKVRSITGSGQHDTYSWDGKDSNYLVVMDGNYTVQLIAENLSDKIFHSNKEQIIVDATPPEFEIKYSAYKFSPDGDGINDTLIMTVSGKDKNVFDSYKIEIFNTAGKKVKEFEGRKVPKEIIWDGRDDYYQKVVRSGNYNVISQATDLTGNKTVLPEKIIKVFILPRIVTKIIKVVEEERGLKISLTSKVLFDIGKAKLKSASREPLSEVVKVLNAYPENNVAIEGHTDSVGSENFNQKLSEKRAKSVYNYLIGRGVKKEKLIWKGYGEYRPVTTNATEEGRSRNRRVEIIILKVK